MNEIENAYYSPWKDFQKRPRKDGFGEYEDGLGQLDHGSLSIQMGCPEKRRLRAEPIDDPLAPEPGRSDINTQELIGY